jgi:hypothetical protein
MRLLAFDDFSTACRDTSRLERIAYPDNSHKPLRLTRKAWLLVEFCDSGKNQ